MADGGTPELRQTFLYLRAKYSVGLSVLATNGEHRCRVTLYSLLRVPLKLCVDSGPSTLGTRLFPHPTRRSRLGLR